MTCMISCENVVAMSSPCNTKKLMHTKKNLKRFIGNHINTMDKWTTLTLANVCILSVGVPNQTNFTTCSLSPSITIIYVVISANHKKPHAICSHSAQINLFGMLHRIKTRSIKFWSCSLSAMRNTQIAVKKPPKCSKLDTPYTKMVSPQ